jgi:hypothetical protein
LLHYGEAEGVSVPRHLAIEIGSGDGDEGAGLGPRRRGADGSCAVAGVRAVRRSSVRNAELKAREWLNGKRVVMTGEGRNPRDKLTVA